MKTNYTNLSEIIGDMTALQRLLRANLSELMIKSIISGTDPDQISVELPLTVVLGMENSIDELLVELNKRELVDNKEVDAYMDESYATAKAEHDAKQSQEPSAPKEASDKEDDCNCPACSLRRALSSESDGETENVLSSILSDGDSKVEVRQIQGELAKSLMNFLSSMKSGSNEPSVEEAPPMAQRH